MARALPAWREIACILEHHLSAMVQMSLCVGFRLVLVQLLVSVSFWLSNRFDIRGKWRRGIGSDLDRDILMSSIGSTCFRFSACCFATSSFSLRSTFCYLCGQVFELRGLSYSLCKHLLSSESWLIVLSLNLAASISKREIYLLRRLQVMMD